MISFLFGVATGYCVERLFSIRIKREADGWYIHYNASKGVRNKKKLF